MNFVRKGPRYLFFRTREPKSLVNFMQDSLSGIMTEVHQALEQGEEDNTIAFITPQERKKTRVNDAVNIIFLPLSPLVIMEEIVNQKITDIIHKIDSGAGQIVMRIPENGEKIINEIKETYQARSVDLIKGIDRGEASDTILSFTDKPIRTRVNSLNLIKENLLISQPVNSLLKELRRDAIRFITHGLQEQEGQWYELKINIYDSHEDYETQYQRLSLVLSDLEAGFILGETWTKDHAIALFSVIAYQIRFFTFLKPEEIKKILLALEYDEKGKRIVDYDLYHKSNKVRWYDVSKVKIKKDRTELGKTLRKELNKNLSSSTIKRLKELE